MTIIKEKAAHLIKTMGGLEGGGETSQIIQKREALKNILKFRGRLPEDFDYKKELAESREIH